MRVPLDQARVGLVTTAGLYRPGIDSQFRRLPGGDHSFRVIPDHVPVSELQVGQTSRAFDSGPIIRDRNLALPLDRLRALLRSREIGSAASHHVSFNGSITAPGRLVRESAPAAAEIFVKDGVQAALLVPV
jgi:D-proline reductase (dithiol) PrdB